MTYSEIDIAANDAIQIRFEVEGVIADILALDAQLHDDLRTRLLSLLNLARVNEARVTGIAQCQRIMIRFWRRIFARTWSAVATTDSTRQGLRPASSSPS